MRIVDIQRRLREVGRIRIGEQVPTQSGGTRPVKLSTFRLTSRDRQVIEAAADVFGGSAGEWKNAPDGPQWQVTTESDALPVIVPPGDMSFSQSYEVWSAGGCKVRCDGRWDHIADKACHCHPEARACDIHTRLSVIVPDLPGLGVWRLDTQGYYAAVELGGIVDVCAQASARGAMLPARLRLEQRSAKRVQNGKVVTLRYAVPVLDVDVHPLALTGHVDPATGEIGGPTAGALPAGPSFTPVPPIDGRDAPSLAEQMASIDEPAPRAPRSNAAAPVPATGLKPRTARDAEAAAPAPRDEGPAGEPADDEHRPEDAFETFAARVPQRQRSKALVAARELAPGLGLDMPSTFDEIRDTGLQRAVLWQLGLDEPPPDGGGNGPATGAGDGDAGEEEAPIGPDGTTSTPAPQPATASLGFTVSDVARFAASVFRRDYDAAPRGHKTKVVDQLRHALVFAVTKGRTQSLNDLDRVELYRIHEHLRWIATGDITYAHDADGVTFVLMTSGEERAVAWSDLADAA